MVLLLAEERTHSPFLLLPLLHVELTPSPLVLVSPLPRLEETATTLRLKLEMPMIILSLWEEPTLPLFWKRRAKPLFKSACKITEMVPTTVATLESRKLEPTHLHRPFL